jgi:hypothetical protein
VTSRIAYRRRTGICLNMIVKNETPVLDRLFRSVRDFIDSYVIVDTGSTDGTMQFIERWMADAGIPGETHRRDWVNFGVNRNEALQLACAANRGDWLLLIDADEELACSDRGFPGRLVTGVTYQIEKHHDAMRYALPNLVDIRHNRWRWRGPVHEYLEHVSGPNLRQRLNEAWIIYHSGEGARSRGRTAAEKFLADARLLEDELQRNPDDHRSRFYLAQSYRDAGDAGRAYEHYKRRARMSGGWAEETYWAQYEAGRMARLLKLPHATVIEELLAACNLRPHRGEALHELAFHCREQQRWGEAFAFASAGARLPLPSDTLFVMREHYEWRLLDELAVAAYWAGLHGISREAALQLLDRHERQGVEVPAADLARIRENLRFAEDKLR